MGFIFTANCKTVENFEIIFVCAFVYINIQNWKAMTQSPPSAQSACCCLHNYCHGQFPIHPRATEKAHYYNARTGREHCVPFSKVMVFYRICCQTSLRDRQAKGVDFARSKCKLSNSFRKS